jgi:hypothetical protein
MNMKWARLENNVVKEVTDISPDGRFHPSLVWVKCPEDVVEGYLYEDKNFIKPEIEEEI